MSTIHGSTMLPCLCLPYKKKKKKKSKMLPKPLNYFAKTT